MFGQGVRFIEKNHAFNNIQEHQKALILQFKISKFQISHKFECMLLLHRNFALQASGVFSIPFKWSMILSHR
jgi:hypothetical protein